MQLYLSPHLDDAVQSCGGTIARAVREGEQAVVLTIFAGDTHGRKLAPRAARYHAKCGLANFWTRRWEDVEACGLLGAGMLHLDFPEILYRYDPHGRPRCSTRADLFSPLRADDHVVVTEVTTALEQWVRRLRPTAVYGPLGLGGHVDHVAADVAFRRAMANLGAEAPRALLYEDMPYAATEDTSGTSRNRSQATTPVIQRLTEQDWTCKLRAVAAYRSQLASIWQGADWRAALRAYAEQVTPDGGLAERVYA